MFISTEHGRRLGRGIRGIHAPPPHTPVKGLSLHKLTLAVGSYVAGRTLTAVAAHVIVTRRAVQARTGEALVDLNCV